jgi:hypothetical protein
MGRVDSARGRKNANSCATVIADRIRTIVLVTLEVEFSHYPCHAAVKCAEHGSYETSYRNNHKNP